MPRMMLQVVVSVAVLAGPLRADLPAFVGQTDSSYSWKKVASSPAGLPLEHAQLHMVSQTWKGTAWQHRLLVVRPADVKEAPLALLIIGGGSWRDGRETERISADAGEFKMALAIATATRLPVAFVSHVPFQPLFDGKHEDQIVAYTFDQFLRTGDDEWPLLLPMTRTAVRAMDTIQDFARKEWKLDIPRFVVTGASKRGWTTWLTAAVDARVAAIAPMVIDVLNMHRQMEHQREAYGGYSRNIGDYTELNIQDRMDTDAGRKLVEIVDPFAYRRRLTMPKFILLGTNDPYWTVDALNLYYDDLPGEKYIHYFANSGHGLKDSARLIGNVSAFMLLAAGKLEFPRFTWELSEQGGALRLVMRSDVKPVQVTVWKTTSETKDFRKSTWQSQSIEATDNAYVHELPRPGQGFAAMLGEVLYRIDQHPLYLSTNLRVVPADGAAGR